VALSPAIFDRYVLALDIAGFLQALTEPSHVRPVSFRRSGVQETDHRQRLLSTRGKRPRCDSAAEKGDEAAPFQLIEFHQVAAIRKARSIPEGGDQVRTCAVQDFDRAAVRCGSF